MLGINGAGKKNPEIYVLCEKLLLTPPGKSCNALLTATLNWTTGRMGNVGWLGRAMHTLNNFWLIAFWPGSAVPSHPLLSTKKATRQRAAGEA